MVSQENIDAQHESRSYRIIIGVIVFVFLLIARYAMMRVARRLSRIRDNMRGWTKLALLCLIIIAVIFLFILLMINLYGKQKSYQEKQKTIKNE